jgi:hypothetical protein
MEYFKTEGMIPDKKLLKIWFKEELIKGAINYRIFTQISSYPIDLFGFEEQIPLSNSIVDEQLGFIWGKVS